MIYVPFIKINTWPGVGSIDAHQQMTQYWQWLRDHAGNQNIDWKFNTGNIYAQGVYFATEEMALMFKLSNNT
jgi:hypothetical protein